MPGKMTKAKLAQMNEAVHAAHLRAPGQAKLLCLRAPAKYKTA